MRNITSPSNGWDRRSYSMIQLSIKSFQLSNIPKEHCRTVNSINWEREKRNSKFADGAFSALTVVGRWKIIRNNHRVVKNNYKVRCPSKRQTIRIFRRLISIKWLEGTADISSIISNFKWFQKWPLSSFPNWANRLRWEEDLSSMKGIWNSQWKSDPSISTLATFSNLNTTDEVFENWTFERFPYTAATLLWW